VRVWSRSSFAPCRGGPNSRLIPPCYSSYNVASLRSMTQGPRRMGQVTTLFVRSDSVFDAGEPSGSRLAPAQGIDPHWCDCIRGHRTSSCSSPGTTSIYDGKPLAPIFHPRVPDTEDKFETTLFRWPTSPSRANLALHCPALNPIEVSTSMVVIEQRER
jgi:hypothetical protein